MRFIIFFLSCFVFQANAQTAWSKDFHLCFFTMNNAKEYRVAKKFFQKITKTYPKLRFHVKEFLPYGEYAQSGFRKLLDEEHPCDGLVLSGHHRAQGFEGERSVGYLPIQQLERWSCSERYRPWFHGIKAIWLQGCATGAPSWEEKGNFTRAYQLIFPNATLFTWSGSAPSGVAHKTIPYHIKNLETFSQKSESVAIKNLFLGKDRTTGKEAWLALRHPVSNEKFFSIHNKTAQSFLPRSGANGERELTCTLSRNSTVEERFSKIRNLFHKPEIFRRQMGRILSELNLAKKKYPSYYRILIEELSSPRNMATFEKIWNKKMGITERLQFYHFYVGINQVHNKKWKYYLQKKALQVFSSTLKHLDHVERKHWRRKVSEILLTKFEDNTILLDPNNLKTIENNEALLALLKAMFQRKESILAQEIIYSILENPFINSKVLYQVAWQTRIMGTYNLEYLWGIITKHAKVNDKIMELALE